jgi:threonine dehydratase
MTQIYTSVEEAYARIRRHVVETPLQRAPWLDGPDCYVYLKLENLQHTGSFKVRGALNFLLSIHDSGDRFVTASSGNHGAAVAFACKKIGRVATVYVPTDTSQTKVDAIDALGAEVRVVGSDCIEAEAAARAFAEQIGRPYISPYNDPYVIAGQGTVATEVCRQLAVVDTAIIAVGGGGLFSGMGSWLRHEHPSIQLIAASPANSAIMAASLSAGRIVDLESLPTLSDGTAGGIEHDTITFPLCRKLVDDFDLIAEEAIAASMRSMFLNQHVRVEGAAGCALAALLHRRDQLRGNVVVVICGGNVSDATIREITRGAD